MMQAMSPADVAYRSWVLQRASGYTKRETAHFCNYITPRPDCRRSLAILRPLLLNALTANPRLLDNVPPPPPRRRAAHTPTVRQILRMVERTQDLMVWSTRSIVEEYQHSNRRAWRAWREARDGDQNPLHPFIIILSGSAAQLFVACMLLGLSWFMFARVLQFAERVPGFFTGNNHSPPDYQHEK